MGLIVCVVLSFGYFIVIALERKRTTATKPKKLPRQDIFLHKMKDTRIMVKSVFWREKSLSEMSHQEWESLCDGCGKCCVLKLQDADTEHTFYTDVSCKLLNCSTAQCSQYENRRSIVPDCVILSPTNLAPLSWMPDSCSYKLIHNGLDLPDWHPLITGNKTSTNETGNSVAGRVIPETDLEKEAKYALGFSLLYISVSYTHLTLPTKRIV